jgi:hypothetical protein
MGTSSLTFNFKLFCGFFSDLPKMTKISVVIRGIFSKIPQGLKNNLKYNNCTSPQFQALSDLNA